MKAITTLIIFLSILFNSNLFAQNKNNDKIEAEVVKYYIQHGQRGGTTTDKTLYMLINGKYIEDRKYDKKFFSSIFSDCPKAYDESKVYLNLYKKSKKTHRIGLWSGLAIGLGGLAYTYKTFNNSKQKTTYYKTAASLLAGSGVYYLFKYKSKKTRYNAYDKIKSAVAYYDQNCYTASISSSKDNDVNKKNISKNKFDRKYEIKIVNLNKVSFLRLNVDFIGLKLGSTSTQLFPGIEIKFFKNGFAISSEFNASIVDGEKLVWKDYDKSEHVIIPNDTKGTYFGKLGITYPFFKRIKQIRAFTALGKSRGIDFTLKSNDGKGLVSWGPIVELELDRSIKKISFMNFNPTHVPFEPKTNNINIPITNPAFFQTSTNITLGINRNLFTSYTLETNDSRFNSKIKATVLLYTYAVAKYNLSHSFNSMIYRSNIYQDVVPFKFKEVDFTPYGFAIGVGFETKKRFFGRGLSIEFGLDPHIDHENYKDYYGKLKAFFILGKVK